MEVNFLMGATPTKAGPAFKPLVKISHHAAGMDPDALGGISAHPTKIEDDVAKFESKTLHQKRLIDDESAN